MQSQTYVQLICVVMLQYKMVDGVFITEDSSLNISTSDRLPISRVHTVNPRKRKALTNNHIHHCSRIQGFMSSHDVPGFTCETSLDARYKVSLQLPDLKMNKHLNDKNSSRYKELSRTLTNDIEQLFDNTRGIQRVSNMNFSAYKRRDKKTGNMNEAGNWQKEVPIRTHSSDIKPSSFLLPTMLPFQSSSPSILKHRYVKTSTPPSTVAASTKVPVSYFLSTKWSLHKKNSTQVLTSPARRFTTSITTSAELSAVTLEYTSSPDTTSNWVTITEKGTGSDNTFNVKHVTRLFKECYSSPGSRDYLILLEPYLEAYSELLSIFKLIGPVFAFSADEAMEKLNILRSLRKEDLHLNNNNYVTIQSMFIYEHSPQGEKAKQKGVSTNKWIYITLKFISGIIKAVMDTSSQINLGVRVQELYSEIMAPLHEWYLRAAVHLAFLSFPSRDNLLVRMGMRDSPEDRQAFADLTSAIDAVYDDVDSLYRKYTTG